MEQEVLCHEVAGLTKHNVLFITLFSIQCSSVLEILCLPILVFRLSLKQEVTEADSLKTNFFTKQQTVDSWKAGQVACFSSTLT